MQGSGDKQWVWREPAARSAGLADNEDGEERASARVLPMVVSGYAGLIVGFLVAGHMLVGIAAFAALFLGSIVGWLLRGLGR